MMTRDERQPVIQSIFLQRVCVSVGQAWSAVTLRTGGTVQAYRTTYQMQSQSWYAVRYGLPLCGSPRTGMQSHCVPVVR